MAITPPIMPVGGLAPAQDAQRLSAYDLAQDGHMPAPAAGPDAVGQLVLDTFSGFQASAAHVQSTLHAMVPDPASTAGATTPGTPAGTAAPGHAAAIAPEAHQQTLGVMMEVFDFAVQSELVSRAATTFTSSVNTLIKTQ